MQPKVSSDDEGKVQRTRRALEFRDFLGQTRFWTSSLAALLGDLAKIGAAISIPLGVLLLSSYLRSASVPFPELGASIGALLTLLTIVFTFVTLFLSFGVLAPAYSRMIVSSSKSYKEKSASWGSGWFSIYCLIFGPYISFLLAVCLTIFIGDRVFSVWLWILLIFGFFTIIWCFYAKGRGIMWDAVSGSFFSCLWLMLLLLIAIAIQSTINGEPSNDKLLLPWLFGIALLHILIVSFVDNWAKMLFAYFIISVFACVFWPGLGFLGGLTLRTLGLGGGSPVTILVKTISPNQSQVVAVEVSGCLLLAISGDVYLKPKEEKKELDCRLRPNKLTGKAEPTPEAYKQTVRYARTDILKIYGYLPTHIETPTKP